jgi:hypothetical protein
MRVIEAVKSGVLEVIRKYKGNLGTLRDEDGLSLLHIAILFG